MTTHQPPAGGAFAGYRAFLEARRAQLDEAIYRDCVAQISLYAALPPAEAARTVAATVGVTIESLGLGSFEPILHWIEDRLSLRMRQGLGLDQALLLPSIFRHHFVSLSIEAVAQRVEDAGAGMLFISDMCDAVAQQIVSFYRDRLRMFEALVENAVDGIAVSDLESRVVYASPAFRQMIGYEDPVGMVNTTFVVPEDVERLQAGVREAFDQGMWRGLLTYRRSDGSTFAGQLTTFLIRDMRGNAQLRGVIVRDVTEQERGAEERAALQEELIRAQEAAIRELSTPLIPLADGVVAMPLVGTIDSARAQQIMETLLDGIATQHAAVALLDITGVRVVDTQVANALLRAAQAARLLGAQIVLTGIGPEIAQTLVGLGADLRGIATRGTLREGIAFALRGD